MSHDPNFGFVVAAYVLAVFIIGGMIAAIMIDFLRLRRALAQFALPLQSQHAEAQSGSQNSARQVPDPSDSIKMAAADPQPQTGTVPARLRFLVFAPVMLFAALAALFFVRLYSGDASLLPSALIGKEVPSFTLPPIAGLGDKPGFSDADLRQGKVALVNVFSSWCVPCRQEHEVLMRIAADPRTAELGVRLFGLAYKDSDENAARFLAENGDPYARAGADRNGRVAIDWGVYGVPETFVVSGSGKIAYRFVGPMSEQSFHDVILPEI